MDCWSSWRLKSLGQRGRKSQAGIFHSDELIAYEEHFQILTKYLMVQYYLVT